MGTERVAYSYCDMCNQVPKCGMKVHVEDDRVVRIEDRENYPAGPLCLKGLAILEEQYHPDRLLYPLKRTTPKGSAAAGWTRISWDEAYDTIVGRLNDIKSKYGPERVGFFVGDPKEPRPAVQRLAYTFGSPNYGTESSLCSRATVMASQLTFGLVTGGGRPSKETGSCLIWTRNLTNSLPYEIERLQAARKRGVKFIVIDPRVTGTVQQLADIHLQLRPGTDGALALGMIHLMVKEGLFDQDFASRWTSGFDDLVKYAQEFPPEEVERITWVPRQRIADAVRMLAACRPATWIGSAASTVHSSNGLQNHRAILCLMALTGDFDVPGGLTIPTHPLPINMFGTTAEFTRERDLLPRLREKRIDNERFPVWARYSSEIQINLLPEYIREGKIRAMVTFGANAMMWPQSRLYQESIERLEFAVAVDYFLRPWTHDFVDMVLPAAMALERMNPVAVFGRKIYLREPAVPPLGEAKPDWVIAFELGTRLGHGRDFWDGDETSALNSLLRPMGLTVEDLRRGGADGVTVPPPGPEQFRKYETGLLRADAKPGFETLSGKVELASQVLKEHGFDALPRYREPVESPLSTPELAREFPLVLNTGSRLLMFTHSKLRELPSLRKLMPFAVVNLHPHDAEAQGIGQHDEVELQSRHGSIRLKANITDKVLPGVIDVSHGWADANVNDIVPRYFDPISGFPAFKEGLCRVRKAHG
jgi:anaerobic selenocysteine-containing dehydrogenase